MLLSRKFLMCHYSWSSSEG